MNEKLDRKVSTISAQGETLEDILQQQLKAAFDLARILDREALVIKARDAEGLNELTPEKLAALQLLEALESKRSNAIAQSPEKSTEQGVNTLWEQVLDVIRICDRKNQLNGAMLSLRQQHVKRAMDLLTNRDGTSTTYAPDGSTRSETGQLGASVSA